MPLRWPLDVGVGVREAPRESRAHRSARFKSQRALIERPPGVPFQKIQFGNERGGRSVLFDSRSCCVSRESL